MRTPEKNDALGTESTRQFVNRPFAFPMAAKTTTVYLQETCSAIVQGVSYM